MSKFRRQGGSLSEQAYYLIRDKILRGEFPMGFPLTRRKLATQFRMSSLPISEAIQRLESEGLVESRPRVGTRVRIPTPQEVRDLYIMREALESQSARLFAEKASSDERLELRKMAAQLDTMMELCRSEEVDADVMYRAQAFHLSFHMRIAECTGSAALREGIEKAHVLVFNWLYDIAAAFRLPPRWHQDLVDVIAEHDPAAADAAMRRHVLYGFETIRAAINSHFGLDLGAPTSSEVVRSFALAKPPVEGNWRSKGKQLVSSTRQ